MDKWSSGHYEVEDIIERKVNPEGVVEYFVKWKDWDTKYNSWVRARDMACPSLIEQFEKENIANETLNPFQRGYEAEDILGFQFKGQPYFLLKSYDKTDLDWVSNTVLKKECPQLLIKYYESSIQWETAPGEEKDENDNNKGKNPS